MSETPSSGAFQDLQHRLAVRVYYEDTDFTGVVYHAGYLRFLERGRSEFLRLAGADHVAMQAHGTAFAVTRLEIDFRRPARIDDALVVATTLAGAGGARLVFSQSIAREGQPICEATVHAACVDPAGRARRPPLALTAAIRPYLR